MCGGQSANCDRWTMASEMVDNCPSVTGGQTHKIGGQCQKYWWTMTILKLHVWVDKNGGQGEIRTRDLYNANVTIFQLIYLPSG